MPVCERYEVELVRSDLPYLRHCTPPDAPWQEAIMIDVVGDQYLVTRSSTAPR